MSEFNKVVAWDKNGPIEVEMYVVVRGKKVPIAGSTLIEEFADEAPAPQRSDPFCGPVIANLFAGRQWSI